MNCIIIDDEKTARVIIGKLCSDEICINVKEEFPNAMQAIKYLNQHEIDLIFLDIHMPNFTGFDFIDSLKNPPKIILTTSDVNFAIQAFEYECIIDYLVKPISLDRFQKAIKKAEEKSRDVASDSTSEKITTTSDNELYVNIDRRLIKIDIQSIYLIEAKGDYIHIKTENKNYTVHSTLKKIENKLPEHIFIKVHRSFIINFNEIIDIEDNSVLIKKDVIPVSRSKRNELMKRLNLL